MGGKTKADATTFTTQADGLVVVTGLKYGSYYLEETAAPENYVLLTNRIQFTVDEHSYGTTEELVAPEKVPNKHKRNIAFYRRKRHLSLFRQRYAYLDHCGFVFHETKRNSLSFCFARFSLLEKLAASKADLSYFDLVR